MFVCDIVNHWQHSTSTVPICIHEVADCLIKLQGKMFERPSKETPTLPWFTSNACFSPYYANFIDALDISHVAHSIPCKDPKPFRKCKGFIISECFKCNFSEILPLLLP